MRGNPASSAGSSARIDRPILAERVPENRNSGIGGLAGIGEVRRPDETHPFERQLVVGRAGGGELVELARPRAHALGRPSKDLLVELRPAPVADRPERVDGEHAEEPLRHGFRDVEGQVPAPRVADDVRPLPAEPVEDAPGIADVRRDGVRPFRRRRLEPSLLVPHDVVLLRELVGETAQVVEAEPGPPCSSSTGGPLPARRPARSGPSSCVVKSVHATVDDRRTSGEAERHKGRPTEASSCALERADLAGRLPARPQLEPGDAGEEERHADWAHGRGMAERKDRCAHHHEHERACWSPPPDRRDDGQHGGEPEQAGAEVEDVPERLGLEERVNELRRSGLVSDRKLTALLATIPHAIPRTASSAVYQITKGRMSTRATVAARLSSPSTSSQSTAASPPMRKSCATWSPMNRPVSSPTSGFSVGWSSPRTR